MSLQDFKTSYEWKEILIHLKRQISEIKESQLAIVNGMTDITKTNIELIKQAERARCYNELIELPDSLFEIDKGNKIKK